LEKEFNNRQKKRRFLICIQIMDYKRRIMFRFYKKY